MLFVAYPLTEQTPACGIVFGHPFDTIKTWQQVHKTSELIKKFSSIQLFGFIMIRLIIVIASYQFTYMRKFNGLRLGEHCDAPHFIFHFEMGIMNDVESCHVITANQPSSCKNSKCGPRPTIRPDFLVHFRNIRNDVQHHHSEQWLEWLLQRLLLSINYKRHHQCTRVRNLWQRDEVGR